MLVDSLEDVTITSDRQVILKDIARLVLSKTEC